MNIRVNIICLGLIVPSISFGAAGICIKPGVTMVVFDPGVGYTSASFTDGVKVWHAQFPYGTIRGISGCYNTDDTGKVPGSVVQSAITITTTGSRCYCKMLSPVESQWVFHKVAYSESGCTTYCARYCITEFFTNRTSRAAMFQSIMPL